MPRPAARPGPWGAAPPGRPGLRRWARALEQGQLDTPAGRWLFRATNGAPLPFLERKVRRLRGGGGENEGEEQDGQKIVYYRQDGQLRSKIDADTAEAMQAQDDAQEEQAQGAAAAQTQDDAQEEQIQAETEKYLSEPTDDSSRLPPLPPPYAMYA